MKILRNFAADKVWVVTGGGSGIGLELVRLLLSYGAVVWALDLNKTSLVALEKEACRDGLSLFTRVLDVTDFEAVRETIEIIRTQSKRVDVWINNAGIQKVGSLTDLDPQRFDHVMQVNFTSVVRICRELIKVMESQGEGTILNMASVAGHLPAPFMSAYVASKHALVGFSRALRVELELLKSPVRCVMASPGFVDTAIIEKGAHAGFPNWLSWMLSDPTRCAQEILDGIASGKYEIEPTINGRAMSAAFRLLPDFTVKSSRILLTRKFTDIIFNRYHIPRT